MIKRLEYCLLFFFAFVLAVAGCGGGGSGTTPLTTTSPATGARVAGRVVLSGDSTAARVASEQVFARVYIFPRTTPFSELGLDNNYPNTTTEADGFFEIVLDYEGDIILVIDYNADGIVDKIDIDHFVSQFYVFEETRAIQGNVIVDSIKEQDDVWATIDMVSVRWWLPDTMTMRFSVCAYNAGGDDFDFGLLVDSYQNATSTQLWISDFTIATQTITIPAGESIDTRFLVVTQHENDYKNGLHGNNIGVPVFYYQSYVVNEDLSVLGKDHPISYNMASNYSEWNSN